MSSDIQPLHDPLLKGWEPTWKVDVGNDCEVGVVMDDGCFLVLVPNENGQWLPTKWIPVAAARFIGDLAARSGEKT